MKKYTLAFYLLIFLAGNGVTAQTKKLPDKPGKWSYSSNISKPGTEVITFNKNLAALAEWFHLNVPMLTNPVGY